MEVVDTKKVGRSTYFLLRRSASEKTDKKADKKTTRTNLP